MKNKIILLTTIFILSCLALTYYYFSYNNKENQLIEEVSKSEIQKVSNTLFEKQDVEIQNWPKLKQKISVKDWNFE